MRREVDNHRGVTSFGIIGLRRIRQSQHCGPVRRRLRLAILLQAEQNSRHNRNSSPRWDPVLPLSLITTWRESQVETPMR